MKMASKAAFVAIGLVTMTMGAAADESHVFLTSRAGRRIEIGKLELKPAGAGYDFSIKIDGSSFIPLYMEDRNFQCLAEEARHYCYLPYRASGHFADGHYAELEHALLFVQKSKNAVDLNPFDGVYYKIAKKGVALVGKPRDVDLSDIEADNSQSPGTPIKDQDLHVGEPEDYLFPTLTIE